jgi:hypothetical protein
VLGFTVWVVTLPSFNAAFLGEYQSFGVLPWFIHPVFLGLTGLLALASLGFASDYEDSTSKMLFIASILFFAFLFGRAVTFINVNVFFTGAFEDRFLSFEILSAAILAPVPLLNLSRSFNVRSKQKAVRIAKRAGVISLIALIVFAGAVSTFVKLWSTSVSMPYTASLVTNSELEAFSYLCPIVASDSDSRLITFSSLSQSSALFAGTQNTVDNELFLDNSPEIALSMLHWQSDFANQYAYVHSRDEMVLNLHNESFLTQSIMANSPVVFQNNEATIYKLPKMAPPQSASDTILVVPFSGSNSTEGTSFAYELMSKSYYNYTTAFCTQLANVYGQQQIDSADSVNWWRGKGTVTISIDPLDKMEGLGSIQGSFEHASAFSGLSLIFSAPRDFSRADSFSFYLKVNSTKGVTRPLVVFRSSEYDYFQGNLENPPENMWTHYELSKSDITAAKGSPSWANITSVSLEFDLTGNPTFGAWVDDLESTGYSNEPVGQVLDDKVFNAKTIVLSYDPSEQEAKPYIDYIKNGGKVIVLNTNGFRYLSSLLLSVGNETLNVDHITGNGVTVNLPENLTTSIVTGKTDANILANYACKGVSETPFALLKTLSKGNLYYLNVYPLVQFNGDKKQIFDVLDNLFNVSSIEVAKLGSAVMNLGAAFLDCELNGNVKIQTNTLFVNGSMRANNITVFYGGSNIFLEDVRTVAISNFTSAEIRCNNPSIVRGSTLNGFYTLIQAEGRIEIAINGGGNMTLFAGKSEHNLANVHSFTLSSEQPIGFYMRQPTITVSGQSTFYELTLYKSLYSRVLTYNPQLRVNGNVTFNIILSSSMVVSDVFGMNGTIERQPPTVGYDEASSIVPALSLVIPLIIACAGVGILTRRHYQKSA